MGGGGVLPIRAYTGRLRPKGVTFLLMDVNIHECYSTVGEVKELLQPESGIVLTYHMGEIKLVHEAFSLGKII